MKLARPEARAARWLGIGLRAALIVAAVATVYAPALRGEWLWDDIEELAQNPVLRDPHGLFKIWFRPAALDYYPLKTTVQWLQWQAGGGSRFGYHLTNLALQAVSALLFWRLLAKLGLRRAWWGGLFFAVHPLGVESVAWMAELKNTLSLPPLLLAMAAYVDFDAAGTGGRVEPGRREASAALPPRPTGQGESGGVPSGAGHPRFAYFRALGWFLASLLCKTAGVMFPCIILLHAWWRRGRIVRRDLVAALPFFALSAVLGAVTFWLQEHRSLGPGAVLPAGLGFRSACAGLVAAFYLCKSVWPGGLLSMYPRWTIDPTAAVSWLPGLTLGAVLVWSWVNRQRWPRAIVFGLGFFLINLFPVLGFVPISHMRFAWAMDHLAYVPLLGLTGLAAAGLGMGGGGRGRVLTLAGATAGLLAWESHGYARLYDRSLELWSHVVARNPEAWLGQYNLGVALDQAGRPAEAERRYEEAIRLNPSYPEAHLNLGNLWHARGRNLEAVAQYRWGLRLRPDYPEAESNLCAVLLELGAVDPAIAAGERAVRLRPDYLGACINLGNALVRARRFDQAVGEFQAALRLDPASAEAHNGWGAALANAGRLPLAAEQFRIALRLQPAYASARHNLDQTLAALAHINRSSPGPAPPQAPRP